MSGHSKWNNIKHKKEKSDAAKAKIFTKIGKEMAVAIKAGGPDPAVNGKLRDLIAKAKANNVPNDNIQRTIKKLECGAEDIKSDDGEYSVYTAPDDLDAVRDAIIAKGYKIDTADLAKVPSTYVTLDNPDDIENMEKMLDKFNEDDDVTAVYTNWDN